MLRGTTPDPSRAFFRATIASQTLLIFPSEEAASNAPPTFILGFKRDGTPFKVLEQDNMDITLVIAGKLDEAHIVGRNISEAICGSSNIPHSVSSTTYDPYLVFVAAPGAPAKYSLTLSRSYNQQHYIWAGPKAREDYQVWFNLPGHPRLFGASALQSSKYAGLCKP